MGISVADNFSYLGGKPLDGRIQYATLATMKAMADATLYEGCEAYCIESDKYYKWLSSNTVDAQTGKWREVSSGGGETYSDFTGATASTAGAHGLVPAPSAGDEGKVLFGNGLWGALPSVDLSVLSNEAFIFSATEKPVGMWTDRKILYAKTVDCGSIQQGGSKAIDISSLNYETIVNFTGLIINLYNEIISINTPYTGSNSGVVFSRINPNETISIHLGSDITCQSGYITLFYTKTTDSPLPSDVKFAGVDENGNVIYKKTFTGTWSATTTAETKTFSFASTLKLRKTEGVYHTQYGDWSINTLNYNVSNNRLDYGVVAYTDPSNNTLVVERKGFYLSPLSGRSFEVDVYYTTTS